MEEHVNTYRLNQGDKEYILTISIIRNSIRLTCKDSQNENLLFSRDFTIEELKRLDSIFNIITSPNEALNYMDKALKMQKVGVSQENDFLKIDFFVTSQGVVHQLEIPLGESQKNFNVSSNEEQYIQTTQTTQSSFNINQNLNLNDIYGQVNETNAFKESLPVIGPVVEDENQNQYISQINTENTNDLNLNSEFVEGNGNFTSGLIDTNNYQETQNTYTTGLDSANIQYMEGIDNTQKYLQNEIISTDVNTDTNIQYTSEVTDTTNQYIADNTTNYISQYETGENVDTSNQYTTGENIDLNSQYKTGENVDITNQLTSDFTQDLNTQYNIGVTQDYTTQFSTDVQGNNLETNIDMNNLKQYTINGA